MDGSLQNARLSQMPNENSKMKYYQLIIIITNLTSLFIGMYFGRVHIQNPTSSYFIMNSKNKMLDSMHKTNNIGRSSLPNMSLFYELALKYKTDKVTLHHYESMYNKYLAKYIGSDISFLEIGIGCRMPQGPGSSAYLWRAYFGSQANIHFIEYDKKCGEAWYNEHGIKLNLTMHYGSQDDVSFLNTINTEDGFDIIVDDGGHTMKQQQTSFTYLLPKVRSGGLYIIEDLQTSYLSGYGGGYHRQTTTIEFIKQLVDDIQNDSPKKSFEFAKRLLSFEISNKIVIFNVK